jgi:glycine cleavage system transcriptional repressor
VVDSGRFTLEGADNPGIVHKVTSILSKNGLNIDKMETSDEIAPHGGTTLFKMRGTAHAYEPVAHGFDPAKIKAELTSLGDDLNCDIAMEDIDEDVYQGSFYAG